VRVIERWNSALWLPTIRCAVMAGIPWLDVHYPTQVARSISGHEAALLVVPRFGADAESPGLFRRPPTLVSRPPVGATCDAIRYGTPDGVRRAGFDTAGFDASEGVSVVVELAVVAGATCGIATTPLRATTAGRPLTHWTVA